MKLTCDACKLTLTAKDEDRGKSFTCPICRGSLREANGTAAKPVEEKKSAAPTLEWSGGTLDDLVYMVNAQALAAVIEIHSPDKKGEVYVLAGGVDEAFAGDLRGDDAMASLRHHSDARYRVELRLPSESGSLASPIPDRGELKSRPLAKLMRYCEEYVLTCDLDAWRGTNETCRVEYRRGNIARTLINGIDAPEQLADVMGWTSGSYRFVLPRLALPQELDSATRAQAKAAAEARISDQKAARKTMFGMPAAQLHAAAAAATAGAAAASVSAPAASAAAPAPAAAAAPPPAAAAQPAMAKTMLGMPAMSPTPAPATQPAPQQAAQRTMLGMPMASSTPAATPRAEGAPSSVVVDSAYATAARGAPEPAAARSEPAYTPSDDDKPTRKLEKSQKAEPPSKKKAKGKASIPPKATARKPAQPVEPPPSTWVSLAIAVSVAAAIIVLYFLIFSK